MEVVVDTGATRNHFTTPLLALFRSSVDDIMYISNEPIITRTCKVPLNVMVPMQHVV